MLTDLQELDLTALKAFVSMCEEVGLRYYAIGGTLLGAVRHKGFIPWDDDVDIAMPREDYDKMIALVVSGEAQKFLGDEVTIACWQAGDNIQSYFAKVCPTKVELREEVLEETSVRKGYLLDIIPLDGTPDRAWLRRLYYGRVFWLRFLCGTANVHTGIVTSRPKWEQQVLRVMKALRFYRFLKIHKIYGKLERLFRRQDAEKATFAGTIMGAYKTKEIVPRSYFGDTYEECSLWEFEGLQIRGPKQWEAYLTHMYGDYRKLPPESERKHHYQMSIFPLETDRENE